MTIGVKVETLSECRETGTSEVLRIRGQMTIHEACNIRELILEALARCNDLDLDLSSVESCDSAGVQLLCALGRTAEEESLRIRVSGASKEVLEALDRAGVGAAGVLGPEWENEKEAC